MRDYQVFMRYFLRQFFRFDFSDKLICAEGPLSRRAPNVNAFGIEREYPCVYFAQVFSHMVKRKLVIGGHENLRFGSRRTEHVKPRIDPIAHSEPVAYAAKYRAKIVGCFP